MVAVLEYVNRYGMWDVQAWGTPEEMTALWVETVDYNDALGVPAPKSRIRRYAL